MLVGCNHSTMLGSVLMGLAAANVSGACWGGWCSSSSGCMLQAADAMQLGPSPPAVCVRGFACIPWHTCSNIVVPVAAERVSAPKPWWSFTAAAAAGCHTRRFNHHPRQLSGASHGSGWGRLKMRRMCVVVLGPHAGHEVCRCPVVQLPSLCCA